MNTGTPYHPQKEKNREKALLGKMELIEKTVLLFWDRRRIHIREIRLFYADNCGGKSS